MKHLTGNEASLDALLSDLRDVKVMLAIRKARSIFKWHLCELAKESRGRREFDRLLIKFGHFTDQQLEIYRDKQEQELELRLERQYNPIKNWE